MKLTKAHFRKKMMVKVSPVLFALIFFLSYSALAAVQVSPIPQPPPTAKLRIYVVAVTSSYPKSGVWKKTQEEYAAGMARQTDRMLRNQGIYEVVTGSDVRAVLGKQDIANWEWLRNDWALAKSAGKALHADYVLCIERSWKINFQQDMTLFNLNTGQQFQVSNYVPSRWNGKQRDIAHNEIIRINYQTIFQN